MCHVEKSAEICRLRDPIVLQLLPQIGMESPLSTPPNLPLRNRRDPANRQVHRNMHNTNNPEPLGVISPIIHKPKDNSKDYTPQVSTRTGQPRQNPVSKGVDVRHQRKVRAITRLVEDGHERDKTNHGGDVVRVHHANDNQEHAREDPADVDPDLLQPEAAPEAVIQQIANYAAERAGDEVQEAEDSGVVSGAGLSYAEVLEVLEVVCAQDGVDGQLTAEGQGVRGHVEEPVQAEDDGDGLACCWRHDDFALGGLDGLDAGEGALVLEGLDVLARGAVRGGWVGRVAAYALLFHVRGCLGRDAVDGQRAGDGPGDVDERARQAVRL